MAREKKQLTTTEKQRKYRVIEKTTFASEFVAIALPYGIMGGVNFDKWFIQETGWKVALGGISAIILLFFSVLGAIKSDEKKFSRKQNYISLLLKWCIAALILFFLREILTEICNIMIFGALGIALALGLDIESTKYKTLADLYSDARATVKRKRVENEIEEEQAREQEKDKVRF